MNANEAKQIAQQVMQAKIKEDSFYALVKQKIEAAVYEGKFSISFKLEDEVVEPTIHQLETEGFKAFTYVDEVNPALCMCVSWK